MTAILYSLTVAIVLKGFVHFFKYQNMFSLLAAAKKS